MHFLTFLAVEADDSSEAIAAGEAFLEPYQDVAYDWYVVGGRWSGIAGGDDVVCAGDNYAIFTSLVERGMEARDREFNLSRQHLIGPDARMRVDEPWFGVGDDSERREAYEREVLDQYRDDAQAFQQMLQSIHAPQKDGELARLGYHLWKMSRMLDGSFDSDSHFYDTVAMRGDAREVLERVSVHAARQWIVVVDMHN